ncbi:MAG: hypothetical protein B7X57_07390 [Erythrobacter sp. 34-65-8]|nr:MAG: hypothetical protein B7X57_07390 [Erythrobacter sp. 34-65-8]
MADDLKMSGPDSTRPALARVQAAPWMIVIGLIALSAWLGWRAFGPDPTEGDPIATTLVAFQEQNRLTVFSAQLSPVVANEDSRFFGALKSRQVAVIPARVDYSIDLSRIEARRLQWDAASTTLSVQLPPVRVGVPNLDEGRAQYLREGVWITREAQDKLTRANTRLAEQQAMEQAANPVLMRLAREAGRTAVRQNLAIPLHVAGFGDVKVEVRYDGEAAPRIGPN